MSLESAVNQALKELKKEENEKIELAINLTSPYQHGFIDLVRYFLNKKNVKHKPISFSDVENFLN